MIRRWLVERGGAIALLVLLVYALLAPQHVVDGDNAEFATVGALGGRPHPSGYPIYVLYLRATSWLPGATPAHTAALATALLAAAAVLVLHAACRAWGARSGAASLAVAMYAASPVVLRMHSEAEVFAPNALVVASVLWLAAAAGPLRGLARSAALGLVAGIGLSNHVTCALVAPVGLLGAVRGTRETARGKALAPIAAIAGLLVGLSAYLYLFAADGPVSFGRVDTAADLLHFILRVDYGGPGSFLPGEHPALPAANLLALAQTLGRAWLWAPAVLGLLALGYRCVRSAAGEPRVGWITLAVSWLVAGPVLALRFNVEPEGLGLYVCQRFHLLPVLLLAIPVATALDAVGDTIAPRVATRARSPGALAVFSGLLFVADVASSLPWLRGVHSPAMEVGARNMLRSLPPGAVVIANADDTCLAADYLQQVIGERRDVMIACWTLTSREWYRDRLAARGVSLRFPFTVELSTREAENVLGIGRPLFVDRSQTQLAEDLPTYPYGVLIRLLPKTERPPPLYEVVELNRRLYAGFDLDYPRPSRNHDYAAVAHRRYAATWVTLSSALERSGDQQAAADALELARSLAPSRD